MDAGTVVARELTLERCVEIASGTMAFHFAKPPGFTFRAGQAVDLVLDSGPGGEARHAFSIASGPYERELTIATRMRDSPFKRALRELKAGSRVGFEGPFGELTLHRDASRAPVFIAGGIGITPFVSLIRQVTWERPLRPMALVYSNRRPEDAAFLEEFKWLARPDGPFRLVATMTGMAGSARSWDGATRPIDVQMIRAAADGLPSPVYYVAGPPGMVQGVRAALDRAGIDEDAIRTESFFGY